MTVPLKEYKKRIAAAKTKAELNDISFHALRDDDQCTVFSKKYDTIINLCVERQQELGII